MPWGRYELRTQYTKYGEQPASVWIEDPNGSIWRDPPAVAFMKHYAVLWVVCVLLLGGLLCVLIGLPWIRTWIQTNVAAPNKFVASSTWEGQEYQYGNVVLHTANMSLTVDSLENRKFTATVQWPTQQTVTSADGSIVTDVSAKRWQYVIHPGKTQLQFLECKGGVYLQFSETAYVQGNSVILHALYYAVACGGQISGVWFEPSSKPSDGPGGEFTLSMQ